MSKFYQVVLCVAITAFFVEKGYGLSCLKCQSTDVNSPCRYGQRSKTTKKQICRGPTAKCFVMATVDEYGSSLFQRGCSLKEVCDERNDDIEFCFSCASKHCNYDVIELDEEVESFLNEVIENEDANSELLLSLQAAEGTNTTTVSSVTTETQYGTLDQSAIYLQSNNKQFRNIKQGNHGVSNSSEINSNPRIDVSGKPIEGYESPNKKSVGDSYVTPDDDLSDFSDFGARLPENTQQRATSS